MGTGGDQEGKCQFTDFFLRRREWRDRGGVSEKAHRGCLTLLTSPESVGRGPLVILTEGVQYGGPLPYSQKGYNR